MKVHAEYIFSAEAIPQTAQSVVNENTLSFMKENLNVKVRGEANNQQCNTYISDTTCCNTDQLLGARLHSHHEG